MVWPTSCGASTWTDRSAKKLSWGVGKFGMAVRVFLNTQSDRCSLKFYRHAHQPAFSEARLCGCKALAFAPIVLTRKQISLTTCHKVACNMMWRRGRANCSPVQAPYPARAGCLHPTFSGHDARRHCQRFERDPRSRPTATALLPA